MTTTLRAELEPGGLSGVNVQNQAGFLLPIAGTRSQQPTIVRVEYNGQRFIPALAAVPPGPAVFQIANTGAQRDAIM
jgi:hypothetical protein